MATEYVFYQSDPGQGQYHFKGPVFIHHHKSTKVRGILNLKEGEFPDAMAL